MKRFFILFFILFFNSTFYSQSKQYVSWSFSQKKISADEFELIFKAKIFYKKQLQGSVIHACFLVKNYPFRPAF